MIMGYADSLNVIYIMYLYQQIWSIKIHWACNCASNQVLKKHDYSSSFYFLSSAIFHLLLWSLANFLMQFQSRLQRKRSLTEKASVILLLQKNKSDMLACVFPVFRYLLAYGANMWIFAQGHNVLFYGFWSKHLLCCFVSHL